MIAPYPIESHGITIRLYDVAPDMKLAPHQLVNFFQDIAQSNAISIGFGYERMLDHGLIWVLTRLRTEIYRRPALNQEVELITWPCGYNTHTAFRQFALKDRDGELLAEGLSAWATVDIESRRLVRLPEFFKQEIPEEIHPQTLEFEGRTPPKLKAEGEVMQAGVLPIYGDMDANGHVNNSFLLKWCLEALPWEHRTSHALKSMDVSFRAECLPGEALTSYAAGDGEKYAHSLRKGADGLELARATSRWARA